jgi:hypothetical protein
MPQECGTTCIRSLALTASLFGLAAFGAPPAEARVTRLEIVSAQSPTFDGLSFGHAGQYEKIYARAYGELDPDDRRNALITDIDLAPRNSRGMVEYSTDVHILAPIDRRRGNGRMYYDVVNRGNKTHGDFNGVGNNDPTTAADAGTGFLMRRGYTMVFAGWEDDRVVAPTNNRATAKLPLATNSDGSPIVEDTITEHIFDTSSGNTFTLPYRAADLDESKARMLVRNHSRYVGGPLVDRVEVPTDVWSYVDDKTVMIDRTHPFITSTYDAGAAYEFIYPARDPIVLGVGMAAVRDVVSFLRHETSSENPLRGSIRYALAHGSSQSGRFLKGFTYWGFNEDEDGRKVFDGILPKISGAHAIPSNDRFGDTNATGRSYQRHLTHKLEFPFTYDVRHDPLSGLTDGIFARCQRTRTCPKVIHMDGGNEVYLKAMSLVTTDGLGHDIRLPDNVRVYLISSTQHGPSDAAEPTATCQQLSNPLPHDPAVRALFVALDLWATRGVSPPRSEYPRREDRTLVPSWPVSQVGFPDIPGVTWTGWFNDVSVKDKSVLPNQPIPGREYVVWVAKTDRDGNDIPGLRHPELQVPLGTHTGWALRRAPFAENEDCALTGQFIPFAKTRAERLASGDPRLSIQERYRGHRDYVRRIEHAVRKSIVHRVLLTEDGLAIVKKAKSAETAALFE